jgi:hypothetical protein
LLLVRVDVGPAQRVKGVYAVGDTIGAEVVTAVVSVDCGQFTGDDWGPDFPVAWLWGSFPHKSIDPVVVERPLVVQ